MTHGASRSGSTSRWPTCPCCRRSPSRSWLTGEPDPRLDAATATLDDVAGLSGVQWAVGDLLVWLARIGRDTGPEALRDRGGRAVPAGAGRPPRRRGGGLGASSVRRTRRPWRPSTAHDESRAARAVEDLERLPAAGVRRPRPGGAARRAG